MARSDLFRYEQHLVERVLKVKSVLSLYIASPETVLATAQELCESRGGRPGLPVLNSPYGLCGREATLHLNTVERERQRETEFRSHVKVEVAVLGSPSLIVLTVSVDVKQHCT